MTGQNMRHAVRYLPTSASQRGFTLVEMLIVVLVLAIASALVVPQLGSGEQIKLDAAANLLASDLAHAQLQTLASPDDPILVVFDPSSATYHLAHQSSPATPILGPTSGQNWSVTFGQGRAGSLTGITIQGLDVGGDDQLGFGAFGQLDQADNAAITLQAQGQTRTLTLDAINGAITID